MLIKFIMIWLKLRDDGNKVNFKGINYRNMAKNYYRASREDILAFRKINAHMAKYSSIETLADDNKERNNIDMKQYDRRNVLTTETNVTMPKYSESWIKHRFPKVYYDIYKSNLKAIKEDLTSQMLDPRDLNFEA